MSEDEIRRDRALFILREIVVLQLWYKAGKSVNI